ncbi:hypothetical protein LXA43DRAFT_1105752 [Ganoderma leucocontextum]|nr:hypothetical protein LXA43DRAFT_1105752 [Ganoderma leucocontextum]
MTSATLGTPATMEELHIVLDKDIPPMRMHLAALINPLLGLRNMKCFTLLCPKLRLVADDNFAAVTRAWPKLRSFRLPQAYWDSSVDSDDEDGYADGDTIPTPEVLRLFRDHCPDLWELVLPHLDLDTGIPDLAVLPAALPHRLKRLAFGAESDAGNFEGREDRARELVKAKVLTVLDDGEAEQWARYILDLFPRLNGDTSLAECRSMLAAGDWIEVLERVRELRESRKSSGPGGGTAALQSSEQ